MEYGFSELLTEYTKRNDRYPFHMPGHKRQPFKAATQKLIRSGYGQELTGDLTTVEWIDEMYAYDVTEVPDLDDNNHPEGYLLTLKQDVEKYYHTKESFLMVNGSSGGLLAAMEATTQIGDEVLIARNCHTSVYREIIHRGLIPRYVYPQIEDGLCIAAEIMAKDVENALIQYPKISVVVIVSPTYEGVISDIAEIASVVHAHNKILIVDEAHGAHFPFTDRCESALVYGADLVVQSLHKTLPAPTQTAVLHRNSDRVDALRLQRSAAFVQTTSPSYLLAAGMDTCLRYMMKVGKPLHALMDRQLDEFYKKTAELSQLFFFDYPGRDRAKLVFGGKHGQMDGPQIAQWLRANAGIELEMCTTSYVLLMVTAFDEEEALDRLYTSLKALDHILEEREVQEKKTEVSSFLASAPEMCLSPYEALWCEPKDFSYGERTLEEAEGCVSKDMIYVYPPGIPVLVSGERIGRAQIECIREYRAHGFEVHGLSQEDRIAVWIPKTEEQ